MASKRNSTIRSLDAAMSQANTPAASAAASPPGLAGNGDPSQALVVHSSAASPSASPDPKRSRSSFPREP
eukprot:7921763-Prorocentrum_lima.AAC.1